MRAMLAALLARLTGRKSAQAQRGADWIQELDYEPDVKIISVFQSLKPIEGQDDLLLIYYITTKRFHAISLLINEPRPPSHALRVTLRFDRSPAIAVAITSMSDTGPLFLEQRLVDSLLARMRTSSRLLVRVESDVVIRESTFNVSRSDEMLSRSAHICGVEW